MSAVSIRRETTPEGGRYVATVEGRSGEAELTFTRQSLDLISADHTGAPDTLRGSGAALALVEHMVADAHKNGFKIVPLCPYVRAQLAKHPDWRDVMAPAS